MHPVFAETRRLRLYLIGWLPMAALVGRVLVISGGMTWVDAATFVLPSTAIYAFVCLSAWYLCRIFPISETSALRVGATQLAAAITAGGIWLLICIAIGKAISLWSPAFEAQFDRQRALLFGMGVMFYLLSAALHYLLLAVEESREAANIALEARIHAREAELKALKAQINPHFVFNSLHSISALTSINPAAAREMCVLLSDFLRSTLNLGNRRVIPLCEELSLIENYLAIEKVRFGRRLQYSQETSAECGALRVPPLLLQPLVENAVKHGIAGFVDGGSIRVRAWTQANSLLISVENDYDPEAPASRFGGLGLRNVGEQLENRYGNLARLDAAPAGHIFRAVISLPVEIE
jgi:two-component system sensor histidine kinase AlgZ